MTCRLFYLSRTQVFFFFFAPSGYNRWSYTTMQEAVWSSRLWDCWEEKKKKKTQINSRWTRGWILSRIWFCLLLHLFFFLKKFKKKILKVINITQAASPHLLSVKTTCFWGQCVTNTWPRLRGPSAALASQARPQSGFTSGFQAGVVAPPGGNRNGRRTVDVKDQSYICLLDTIC